MAGGQLPAPQIGLHRLRQLEQAERVGDMRPALADHLAELALAVAVLVDELLVADRLLERVEVRALDVLDDREFERLLVADVMDDDRHLVQAGPLRRAPAPLAGDDLVALAAARRPGGRGSAGRRPARGSRRRDRRDRRRRRPSADCAGSAGATPPAGGAARDGPAPRPRRRCRRSAPPGHARAAPRRILRHHSLLMFTAEIMVNQPLPMPFRVRIVMPPAASARAG